MNRKRNITLETLKLFASYMVVFIHVSFNGIFGIVIDSLARFAVPFFFLISGFYSYQTSQLNIKKRVRKLIRLFLFSSILYTIFNMLVFVLENNNCGIGTYFSKYTDVITIVKLLLFNVPACAEHLWYLLAIIYVYIIFYLLLLFKLDDVFLFLSAIFLLFLHILLGEVIAFFGFTIPIIFMRNFVMMGFPFFSFGLFVKKYEKKIYYTPNYVLIICTVLGVIVTLFSRYYSGKKELYFGTLFILFTVIVLFIKYSSKRYSPMFDVFVGCSTYIYIFHIIVSYVIKKIYILVHININSFVVNIHPLIVCVVSTILAYYSVRLINYISDVKEKVYTRDLFSRD